ncbi:Ig-like domain-containing protein [Pectobacterium parvum]|uniref:Ig-like domain-containing protein n=1 Tax=Pectobacterium parvum TaxID=2778550 RepID=UPI0015F28DEC|nr:Ig-like domain-containing protein [Pectobacterium parvum]
MAWHNWFTRYPQSANAVSKQAATNPMQASSLPAYVLEPRILFDGAIAATVNDTAANTSEPTAVSDSHASTADQTAHDSQSTATQDIDIAAVADGAVSSRKEVAFVDTSVKDYQTLVAGIKPGVEVVLIDGSRDGLQQMADWAATHTGYDAIHVFSHGSEGKVNLGTQVLTDSSLKSSEVQAQLAALGAALTTEGDLLLYGCDIAGGANGDAFLANLAQATGADVAASVDATGSSLIGGDWILEKTTGGIDTEVMAIESYSDVLETVVFNDYDPDLDATKTTITRTIDGKPVTFSGGIGTGGLYIDPSYGGPQNGGLYAYDGTKNGNNTELTIKPPSGYTFDITGIRAGATTGVLTFTVTDSNGGISSFNVTVTDSFSTITSFPSAMNDVTQVVISSGNYSAFQDIVISDIKLNVPSPAITSAAYNAGTNVLTVTGVNLATGDTIDVSKLTLVGENGNTYTLTSSNVTAVNATTFSITLNSTDQINVEGLLNKNGTTSAASGTTFNLSAAAGWNATQSSTPADLIGNGVTVSNVQTPTITSSTYDNATGTLTVTGTNLVKQSGLNNDIDISRFTFTGQGGSAYTLSATSNVEIINATAFVVVLSATDRAGLSAIINQNGTSSSGGTTYNLAAADDWNGPITGGNIADLTGNGITVSGFNAAPVIGNLNGDGVNFTEGASPISLDAGGNATVTDADSADFNGGSVRVAITTNRNSSEDVLGIMNLGTGSGQIGVSGSNVTYGGVVIGTFTGGTGNNDLVVALNASATPTAVQALVRALSYQNSNTADPAITTRFVSITVNDGDGGSASAMVAVGVTGVNDAPTLSATGNNVTYTENGSAVDLFSNVSVSTVEAGQNITRFSLVISNVSNGSSEQLQIDGTTIALINSNSGTTTANGLSYSVSVAAGTATLTLSKAGGISASVAAAAIDGITYRNTSENPTGPTRTVTLMSISDNGGTSNGGVETTTLSIAATVTIVAVNDSPTISAPTSITVTEDLAKAITGISFADVDANSNDVTVTLSVGSGVLNASNAGVTVVGSGTSSLTLTGSIININAYIADGNVLFNPASNATGNVTLTVGIDDGGNTGSGGAKTASSTVTLSIDAVNDAPVNGVPVAQAVQQDGSLVFNTANGNLISVSDVDIGGNTMEVTLTASNGLLTLSPFSGLIFSVGSGADDSTMTFQGSLTNINNALNGLTFTPTSGYNGSASIQIVSNDLGSSGSGGAQTDTDTIAITVNPNNPTITSVSASSADGAYKIGQAIQVTVAFDSNVVVDTTGGVPTLLLETGAIDRVATYVAGSGSNTLTFEYIVQSGDLSADLNYASTSALSLNGATIQDNANRTAVLTLPGLNSLNSLAAQKAIVIDGVLPTATIAVSDNALKAGETTEVTITFSEAVTGFSNANLSVADGTLSNVTSTDGGVTWTATLTPNTNVTNAGTAIGLTYSGITDAAGNAGVGSETSGNISIDTALPTATIAVSDNALKAGETTEVTITFSEAVSGFSNANLSVIDGTLSNVTSSDGGVTWTATLTPDTNVTNAGTAIGLNYTGVTDAAGNAGVGSETSGNISIDTALPTATIAVSDNALKAGESTVVTITFSEAVSSFSNANLSVADGTLSNVTSSDGGVTWTATFTPNTNVTNAGMAIGLTYSGITDAAGNAGVGSETSGNISIDTALPTATIAVSDNALKAGESAEVTITFSEAVTGFSNANLSVADGTLSNVTSSDGGVTWKATFTPNANVTNAGTAIGLTYSGVTDAAGNAGVGSETSDAIGIDTALPTATITLSDSALKAGESAQVTITFSEAVTGFSSANLSVADGTLSNVISTDGGVTWTATFTPNANVTNAGMAIGLNYSGVTDAAGNAGVGSETSGNISIDTALPTATIAVSDNALKAGESAEVTITFSEAVSGFSNANLTVADGTLSNVISTDGGVTWKATFTPNANVTNAGTAIGLTYSGVTDAAGNAGVGSETSGNISIDTTLPTATIAVSDNALKAGESAEVTITFSEAVTGFSNANLSVADGTLSNVTSIDGGVTWTATFTPNANVTNAGTAIGLTYSGVTDAAGNAGVGTVASDSVSIDTARPVPVSLTLTETSGSQALSYTLVFSEAVTGLDIRDFSLLNANGTTATIGAVTALSPTTYRIDLTNVTGAGAVQLVFTGNHGGVTDLAGNDLNGQGLSGDVHSNTAPVTNGIGNQSANQGSTFTFTLPTNAFVDNDAGDSLAYHVSLSDGSALPSWLVFNPQTKTFSGTPQNADVGLLAIRVTATDKNSVSVSSGFTVVVNNVNDAPTTEGISNQTVNGDGAFSFQIPANTFSDIDVGDTLRLSATQADGSALPAWVNFDPATGTFSGSLGRGNSADLSILVTATDVAGASVSTTFVLRVQSSTQPDGDPEFKSNAGRPVVAIVGNNAAVQSQLSLLTIGAASTSGDGLLGAPSSLFNAGTAEGSMPGTASVFSVAAQGSGVAGGSAVAVAFANNGVNRYEPGIPRSNVSDFNQSMGGKSTLAGMFANNIIPDNTALEVFSGGSWQSVSEGNSTSVMSPVSVFGAPVFSQQLKALDDYERLQIASLEGALQNMSKPA